MELRLRSATDAAWVPLALAHLDEVLVDHAHCEKKAAAHALSMLSAYPEVPGLARAMARLAREEAQHLAQVVALLERRHIPLGRDPGDPYAQQLQRLMRPRGEERKLDQLLISALIEARSQERLGLLGMHLPEPELAEFYRRLALAEAGHANLFGKLALRVAPEEVVVARAEVLLEAEAEIVRRLPLRPAIH